MCVCERDIYGALTMRWAFPIAWTLPLLKARPIYLLVCSGRLENDPNGATYLSD